MRSGVVGLMPRSLRDVDEPVARRIRAAGFTGVTVVLEDPLGTTREELTRVRDVLAGAGVRVAQANPRYERLVDPDETRRQAGVRALQRACSCGRWLNAATVYVRPGSLSESGHW